MKKTIKRKNGNTGKVVKEWSRMLHKWWKRDRLEKIEFRKTRRD